MPAHVVLHGRHDPEPAGHPGAGRRHGGCGGLCLRRRRPRVIRRNEMAKSAATMELHLGDHETQVSLEALKRAIRGLAADAWPARDEILLVSPGFLESAAAPGADQEVADRAVHAAECLSTVWMRAACYTIGRQRQQEEPSRVTWLQSLPDTSDSVYCEYAQREKTADADILRDLAGCYRRQFHSQHQ